MTGAGWIKFEGYEGRLDPGYGGSYGSPGIRYPFIERTRTWDIVRIEGEPVGAVYRRGQYVVLSRGYDMMKKAHEEAAAYRLHFKRCAGAGLCQDIGHPGGPRRSLREALPQPSEDEDIDSPIDDVATPPRAVPPPPAPVGVPPAGSQPAPDWIAALHPVGAVTSVPVVTGLEASLIPLEFALWEGPLLGMREDCNKRGGRVIGNAGDLSCAEVEIVKRLRAAGWNAAWVQAFKCGRNRWSAFISDPPELPRHVQAIQTRAGTGSGHPDVVAWTSDKVVFVESKGVGDALRATQLAWFERLRDAGFPAVAVGIVNWRPTR